jgi:hypothetical protein
MFLLLKKIIIIASCLLALFRVSAQDVVFICNGKYYSIKSSTWDTPLSQHFDKYAQNVNMDQLQLPFEGGFDKLKNQIKNEFNFNAWSLRFKEILVYDKPVNKQAGELRYMLKITRYYYLPVSIPFNNDGDILSTELAQKINKLNTTIDYCYAIQVALRSFEFNEFFQSIDKKNIQHGKSLAAIQNIRLSYIDSKQIWAWSVFTSSVKSVKDHHMEVGKVAYVDALSGELIKVDDFRQFNEVAKD